LTGLFYFMPFPYFDTHTHAFYSFSSSHPIHRLFVSTQPKDFPEVPLDFKASHNLYAIGIHPWFAHEVSLSYLPILRQTLMDNKYVAMGEIGLDYFQDYKQTQAIQLDWFEAQLDLAMALNLPVSIHARKSLNEVYSLLKYYPVKFVLHGFSGSLEQAKSFIALGGLLGINGVVCYPNAQKILTVIRGLPMSSFVLETDYPYVKDLQGQPILLNQVAERFAAIKAISIEEVIELTYLNANNLFRRDDESTF